MRLGRPIPFILSAISIWLLSLASTEIRGQVKLATFDIDATPPTGFMMAYDPVRKHDELSLRCRGIVLLGADDPIVLCAVDWIGISNGAQDAFRDALAKAAGTTRNRVAVHSLHQHDAPGADFTAENIVREMGLEGYKRLNGDFARDVIKRAAEAIRHALPEAQPVSHYGWGEVKVEKIASNRRMLGEDGKVKEMRWTRTPDARLRAEPEGVIDPEVSLLSFWNEDQPVAVLSYYACHPQSYYRTGIPSSDFPGIARFMRGQGQPAALHVHFNGAGGNIGAGKYNDGNTENRIILAHRLAEGMRKAWTTTEKRPLGPKDIAWLTEPVHLPPSTHLDEGKLVATLKAGTPDDFLTEVDKLAWLRRNKEGRTIDIECLSIGRARVLFMPGELFVEYQLAAKAMRPDLDVAMAAYGEYGTGYIGTAVAYEEGGYETSERASNVGPGSEAILMDAMKKLLGKPTPPNDFHIPERSKEEALASFETLDGFEVQLVASEPDVLEPVVIAYDADGQMYVAEYLKFPTKNGISHGPDGRIRLLRDLDGDGYYEWSQVFANHLAWPTGICPWNGGVFVVASPDIWYLKDTDGDGEAEVREMIFTGFGFSNDEGTANNLIWGLDNWIYGAGSNSGGEIRPANDPAAKPVSLRNRDFRFHPETLRFEAISGSEQFGNTFDDWGNRFLSQNSKPGVQVVLPSHYLERNPYLAVNTVLKDIWEGDEVYRASEVEPWRRARTKVRLASERKYTAPFVAHDVFTGVAGITVYRGDAYPESVRGNLFAGEVQSNLVHRWKLVPDGVTLRAIRVDKETEILRSKDNWFRPANSTNAPDGTLHIADMNRQFIETPDSLPDDIYAKVDHSIGHDKGRIYRLAPTGFKAPPPPQLSKASTAELVAVLENRNGWWRDTASRLIFEKQDPAAIPLLKQLFSESRFDLARLHAMYALAGLHALEIPELIQALKDKSSGIREHALRLSEPYLNTDRKLLDHAISLAGDKDTRVRFQAAFSLGQAEDARVIVALAKIAAKDVTNPWIRTAILSSPPEKALPLFEKTLGRFAGSHGEFLSQLVEIIGARNVDEEVRETLGLIAKSGGKETQSLVVGLGKGQWHARSSLARFATESTEVSSLLSGLVSQAIQTLDNDRATGQQTIEAIEMLAHASFEDVGDKLLSRLDAKGSPKVQVTALNVLTGFGTAETASRLLEKFPSASPTIRGEIIEALLGREGWTTALLESIEAGKISRGDIAPFRQQRLMEHGSKNIRNRAVVLFGKQGNPRSQVIEDYQAALSLSGNRERGQKVFEQNCMACHRLGSQGQNVGPDLATVQNQSAESLLIHILDPNREVDGSYTQYLIELEDGSLLSGRIETETSASITIQRAGGIEDSILRQNIRHITGSGISLMPEGLEQTINHQQMRDLIALLLKE